MPNHLISQGNFQRVHISPNFPERCDILPMKIEGVSILLYCKNKAREGMLGWEEVQTNKFLRMIQLNDPI